MAVEFPCPCGQTLRSKDGRPVDCAVCGRTVAPPEALAGAAEGPPGIAARPFEGRPWARRSADTPAPAAGEEKKGSVLVGSLMMVGAVVWFVGGRAAGWTFFYPIILFIMGLISFVRGLAGR